MTAPIRVLIVDDDALVRSGLTMMLSGAPQIEVIGEADDGRGVLAAVDLHRPDVVLMDIRMPRLDGIAATRLLSAQPHPPAVLVLTTFDADELVLRALQAGAAGFLLKDSPPADIVRAIDSVYAGDGMLSPRITRRLINLVAGDPDAAAGREQARQRLAALTPREREVAAAVAGGSSNAEIATRLHLSLATVKAHVSRLLVKLDAANRVQIALLVQDAASRPRLSMALPAPGQVEIIEHMAARLVPTSPSACRSASAWTCPSPHLRRRVGLVLAQAGEVTAPRCRMVPLSGRPPGHSVISYLMPRLPWWTATASAACPCGSSLRPSASRR